MAWRGGTEHETGRYPRPSRSAGRQGSARNSRAPRSATPGHAVEPAQPGRACRWFSAAVLGATIWSLQPSKPRGGNDPAELYNVDRVSRSEGLDRLPSDYSKLPPPPLELGPPLPGDLGPAIVQSQRPAAPSYTTPGYGPAEAERLARLKEAEEAAASSVFFRTGGQRPAMAVSAQPVADGTTLVGFDPLAAGPASTAAQPLDPTNRHYGKPQFREAAATGVSVPGHGRYGDRRRVGHGHQV